MTENNFPALPWPVSKLSAKIKGNLANCLIYFCLPVFLSAGPQNTTVPRYLTSTEEKLFSLKANIKVMLMSTGAKCDTSLMPVHKFSIPLLSGRTQHTRPILENKLFKYFP